MVTYSDPQKQLWYSWPKAKLVNEMSEVWLNLARSHKQCDESQATADRRLELLREREWVYIPGMALSQGYNVPVVDAGMCLFCQNFRFQGHADDCRLAKELSDET